MPGALALNVYAIPKSFFAIQKKLELPLQSEKGIDLNRAGLQLSTDLGVAKGYLHPSVLIVNEVDIVATAIGWQIHGYLGPPNK